VGWVGASPEKIFDLNWRRRRYLEIESLCLISDKCSEQLPILILYFTILQTQTLLILNFPALCAFFLFIQSLLSSYIYFMHS